MYMKISAARITYLFNGSNKVHNLSKNDIGLGKIASLIRYIATKDANSKARTCGQNSLLSCVQCFCFPLNEVPTRMASLSKIEILVLIVTLG